MKQTTIIDYIDPRLQRLIKDKGWISGLTDIQKKAIPILIKKEDCIIEAPTAGGKTEAVLFPVLTNAAKNKKESIQILYLAPLRALLNDIENRAKEYSNACGLHSFKWHGDVSQKDKIEALHKIPQVLLTTPESLEAILLRKSSWSKFFNDLQCIIIDEAHNFASSDRGSHIISLLERIEFQINKKPQRIALSATIGNPDEMLKWIAGKNRKPGTRISVHSFKEKEKDYQVQHFIPDIINDQEVNPDYIRLMKFHDLVTGNKKSIAFCPSRKKAEEIASAINLINEHYTSRNPIKIRTHHSSVSKFYREDAEKRIKIKNDLESELHAIISTSTLELGIDIGELDQVIQFDALTSSSAFLQRVGRTGRRPGKPQFFRGLTVNEDDLILLTAVVNLGLKGTSEFINFPKRSFHILAHQLICLSLQNYGINKDKAWHILSSVYCFSKIEFFEFEELVSYMVNEEYFRNVDGELVVAEETEKQFLSHNWKKLFAVFESGPLYEVFDEKNIVGTLDESFVESQQVPFYIILGGIEWEAFKVKEKNHQVFVKKTKTGQAPKWDVFSGLEVPYITAKEVGKLLFSNSTPEFLTVDAKEIFNSVQIRLEHLNWDTNLWVIVKDSSEIKIWTFAGERINRTLVKLITGYYQVKASANYMNITIKTQNKKNLFNIEILHEFFDNITESGNSIEDYNRILENSLQPGYFTKFSNCIPDKLKIKTLSEKSFDTKGLIDELNNVEIRIGH